MADLVNDDRVGLPDVGDGSEKHLLKAPGEAGVVQGQEHDKLEPAIAEVDAACACWSGWADATPPTLRTACTCSSANGFKSSMYCVCGDMTQISASTTSRICPVHPP